MVIRERTLTLSNTKGLSRANELITLMDGCPGIVFKGRTIPMGKRLEF